jgi:putative nucleotidyltransferase with HDIG domain
MELNKKYNQLIWRNILTIAILILVLMSIIFGFLPRNDRQGFHYDIGKPWLYGSLIAKFDFPIYKTDEVLQHERDSVFAEFQPYYIFNGNIEKEEIAKLQEDYAEGFPGLPYEYLRIITNRLHRIYQAGVMDTPEYNELAKDSTKALRIVNGKEAESRYVSYVYSTRTAYEQLFVDEEFGGMRQILQKCNLNEYIEPNIIFDKKRTETERNDLMNTIPVSNGMVVAGQKIIDRGEIVDARTERMLASFEKEKNRRSSKADKIQYTLLGQIIYVSIIMMLFTSYLFLFRREYFDKLRSVAMLYLLITIFSILVSLTMKHNFFSVYIIPLCIAPIFVRVFMDSRTAFITHATIVLICAAAVNYQYEFIIVQLVAGLVAIYSLRELSRRSQVLRTALLTTIASALIYYALQLMQSNELLKMDTDMYYHFFVNGVLLLLSYPLMYLVEKMFNFNSDVTLFELSNTNKGLLRELSETAPGTFQHSITVANIAAVIANKIGADSLLVRTGALYHDIGKMESPVYFTENQVGTDPHKNLNYIQSAQAIVGHIYRGVALAEKYGLPQFIKDFILTHHGRGVAKYFYIMQKNAHPGEEIDPEPFTYPGPNPFTREQAILMMADGVEAASRSLTEYTETSITELVDKLVDGQVAAGFFKDCPITFRDIEVAKQTLIERLKSIYHTRISYPEANTENDKEEKKEEEKKKDKTLGHFKIKKRI